MMNSLPLAFLFPWALAALPLLAVLWWIIRRHPPRPARHVFPALRILRDLQPRRRHSQSTPPWLLALRLLIGVLAILAAARPVYRPAPDATTAPALIVVVNDWTSAANWQNWVQNLHSLTARILRRDQVLNVLALDDRAPFVRLSPVADMAAAQALIGKLRPLPWPADYGALAQAVARWQNATGGPGQILWLSSGLGDETADMEGFYARLSRAAAARMIVPAGDTPLLLSAAIDGGGPRIRLQRPLPAGQVETHTIVATNSDGIPLASTRLQIAAGAREGTARIDVARPLAARIARLSLAGREDAATTVLIGDGWRYPVIGLAETAGNGTEAPLLDPRYYLKRALKGIGALAEGDPATLVAQGASVIILPDASPLSPERQGTLKKWVEGGGLLIRFPGARPFGNDDPLLTVPLRSGERRLDGALNWTRPQGLAPFPPRSPFYGLTIPPDIRIRRQILARPSMTLEEASWATLSDGTPLVTARRMGKGTVVLFHITADSEWSNLPQSGLFVAMLESLSNLGAPLMRQNGDTLPPLPARRLLDGFGRLFPAPVPPPLLPGAADRRRIGPTTPPGLYGNEKQRIAFNLAANLPPQAAIVPPTGIAISKPDTGIGSETDLTPWLVALALLFACLDALLLAVFYPRRSAAMAMLLPVLLLPAGGPPLHAQENTAIPPAAMETRFAYILTGDEARDRMSAAGLQGLSRIAARRSSIEPGPPDAVDPARDELIFYPFLYWPFGADQADISERAAENLRSYMRLGGTLVIDTADAAGPLSLRRQDTDRALRRLLRRLRAPALRPLPADHVLLRSFYLLQSFPGRWNSSSLWIGDERAGRSDGVATLIVGNNDWAAAWAMDEDGLPLAATGGNARQRELAFRFGINLASYTLTGNYKADQVHIPAILKRLSQ